MRILVLSATMYVLLGGCKPDSVHTEVAGYGIRFPITMAELQKQYPNGYKSFSHKFIDSTQSVRTEWWFDTRGNSGNRDSRSQPYGVSIFLKNKGNRLDSVKTTLEQQYKQSLKPLTLHELEEGLTPVSPPVYVCHINKETILVLRKAAKYRGDSWSEYNSLRISIGYNLNKKEEEFFTLFSGGTIHEDIY